MDIGTLYWITGLSGAGKTTIGTLLYNYLKTKKENVIFLEGDLIREAFGYMDYTTEGRRNLIHSFTRLYKLLTEQNIDIVSCQIAMYDECREWNRNNFLKYKEIYLKVDKEILIQRDSKGIYSKALNGEINNVIGIDLPFEEPKFPDLTINNNGRWTPKQVMDKIIQDLHL